MNVGEDAEQSSEFSGTLNTERDEAKHATALKYDFKRDQAPEVVATGTGEIAEEIVRVAESHDIPVYKDPSLARALGQLELGSLVPAELYKAVAEVLVFVYSLDQAHKKEIEMVLEDF